MDLPRQRTDALSAALAVAAARLEPAPLALALAADDQLRLDLPPLPSAAEGAASPKALAALGALYLAAELEEAGVLQTVETLVARRHSLALRERGIFEKLERWAREAPRLYFVKKARDALFARAFALGGSAGSDPRAASNLGFAQRLAQLAGAILRCDEDRALEGRVRAGEEARLRVAAQALVGDLGILRAGDLLFAARRLIAQITAALDILGDPGLTSTLGTRSAWETLERLAGDARGDLRNRARRGTAGQSLLVWVGDHLPALIDASKPLPPPDATAVRAAVSWLATFGIAAEAGLEAAA